MRARTIKPGFFLNDRLGKCSPLARLFFIGLFGAADWEGRLEYRPTRLRAEILPYDHDADVSKLVREIIDADPEDPMIVIYGDGKYLYIPNFTKHQNPHPNERKYPSVLPIPESFPINQERSCNVPECSGTFPEDNAGSSGSSGPSGPLRSSGSSSSTATQDKPGNGKPAKEVPPNIRRILKAYAHACKLRPDWIPQPSPPGSKQTKHLMELRASETDYLDNLGKYVKLVTALDWAEAKDFTFFLRRRTFENCLSGEYAPSQKKNGQPAKDPDVYDWATEQQNNMLRAKGIIP